MQKVSYYIKSDLQSKAKLLYRLTLSLRTQLPSDLAHHCWVANVDKHILTIVTNDSCLASRIRFQQGEILKLLNHELNPTLNEYLKRIKIKINKVLSGTEVPTKTQKTSSNDINLTKDCSNQIKDLSIKNALNHLTKKDSIN